MNKYIYMMVGIPASGKSTFAKDIIMHYGTRYISRDEIRFSMMDEDQDNYFKHENQVFAEFVKRINDAMFENCQNIIADATHISKASRKKLVTHLKPEYIKDYELIIFYMDTPFEECLIRNDKRTGNAKVPREAMYNMERWFDMPEKNEFRGLEFKNVRVIKVSNVED